MGWRGAVLELMSRGAPLAMAWPQVMALANRRFETGSNLVQDAFVRVFSLVAPSRDFTWNIQIGDRTVITPVLRDDVRSWQFALSYKWHDRALLVVETALLDHLP